MNPEQREKLQTMSDVQLEAAVDHALWVERTAVEKMVRVGKLGTRSEFYRQAVKEVDRAREQVISVNDAVRVVKHTPEIQRMVRRSRRVS